MSVVGSPTASSIRSEVNTIPDAIRNMPTAKLQKSLVMTITKLRQRDELVSTLRNQLKATAAQASLATSTPSKSAPLEAANVEIVSEVDAAKSEISALHTKNTRLKADIETLVESSKQSTVAHEVQISQMKGELDALKRELDESKEAKELSEQMAKSLKEAVSTAMEEKESTFELLGGARELNAELQDALRSANAEIRVLQAQVAALQEEIDSGLLDKAQEPLPAAECSAESHCDVKLVVQITEVQSKDDQASVIGALQGELEAAKQAVRALQESEFDRETGGSVVDDSDTGELKVEVERLRREMETVRASETRLTDELDKVREELIKERSQKSDGASPAVQACEHPTSEGEVESDGATVEGGSDAVPCRPRLTVGALMELLDTQQRQIENLCSQVEASPGKETVGRLAEAVGGMLAEVRIAAGGVGALVGGGTTAPDDTRLPDREAELDAEVVRLTGQISEGEEQLKAAVEERDAALKEAQFLAASIEPETRRKAAAALKKSKALYDAQMAELRAEVEAALKARHEDVVAAEERVAVEQQRVAEAEAVAAARAQAVEEAKAEAVAYRLAADEDVAQACEARDAAEAARAELVVERDRAVGEKAAAEEAAAGAAAEKERAVKEAAAREVRLKKALGELRHKVDAAASEESSAKVQVAEARARAEALGVSLASAEAKAQLLEREVDRVRQEGVEYRSRAQALLAQKDEQLAAERQKQPNPDTGASEALALVREMRADLSRREQDSAAALDAAHGAAQAAERRADEMAEECAGLRAELEEAEKRLEAAEAAAVTAKSTPTLEPAPQDPGLAAQLQAALTDVRNSQLELAAFKQMASQMLDARDAALAQALEQVADLKAEVEELRAQSMQPPATPPLGHPGIDTRTPFDHAGDLPPRQSPDDNFELGDFLSFSRTGPAVDSPAPVGGLLSAAQESLSKSVLAGNFASAPSAAMHEIQALQERISELEEENQELVCDAQRAEAQMILLKEEIRAIDLADQRAERSGNAQIMEFLKANVISLYATGEAERLLDPLCQLLSLSDTEKAQCKAGLSRWKTPEASTSAGYLSFFGMS